MVSDTRSARKGRDNLDGHGSKQKVNMGKNSSVRSPGNTDKASASGQMTVSPLSVRKSKRLEKEMPASTSPAKRTSERLGTCNTPSPLRRSDRGKKDLLSSSDSKQSAEEPLSNLKRKKEKTVIQVTMESKKAEVDVEVVGLKRKKMNARKFRALFKKQRVQDIVPDGGNECSKSVVGKLRDERIDKASEGALEESTLRGYETAIKNDIILDSCLSGHVVDEPCSKYFQIKSNVRDMSDNPENFSTNCSTENMDFSESTLDGSASENLIEGCVYPEEDAASPSLVSEHCNLEGPCHLCSKSKRVGYDLPEQELCSCSPMEEDPGSFATCKATSDLGDAVTSESAGEFDCGHPLIKMHADSHTDGCKKVCGLCNKDGDLLYCEGKSCRRCYHLSCLDPPLTVALPGVWHCPQCVKKKLLFGVHSVSNGVESVWGVREVEVPNAKGIRQRQFLVKYCGLAHVHNHWVPEKQLLLENPFLISNFLENDQVVGWNAEWMVPHRLLWKRPIQDKIFVASTNIISVCEFEWLVKWRGLNYDHATWELDDANFISSSPGQELVKDYEIRQGKANQEATKPYSESIARHSEIPTSQAHANENYVLENAIKLREFLSICPNAVVFYDQERTATAIVCIHSMIETHRSFLIVTTSDSLSRWEADFERLVPFINLVVYSGSSDTRKYIRASEFYDGGGCMMVQVLLSSVEAVLEDLEILRSIQWKAIVIDEYQHSGIANELEQIKMLSTEMRIILVSDHIKDISEHLKILSLVEPHDDFDKLKKSLKTETNDNLSKLRDRLSRFIVYGGSSHVSKFIEYWVPVQISNLQLEVYCDALLSKSNTLCSCSKKDPVGVLREILLTVRKCCDHPYLLDGSEQARLIANKHPAAEILDIGIKASGKLQLLDLMLTEIKTRGLQVLILFQVVGSGALSTGNILVDYIAQRFGIDTYERVDSAYCPSEKQAAVNRFNTKKTGQFVFLLENRACSHRIRLSSLDVVVIYDSDWNPANDLRALKKISIDSKEQIKVFRLYSSFTIEERSLMLAKKNLNLDNSSQHFSRSTSNLLSWGATYLFSKLEEYHAHRNSSLALNFLYGQSLLDEVNKEFRAILSENFDDTDLNSVISEATLDDGCYHINTLMFGESKVQLKDGEVPHVFWRNLLEGKNPRWRHLSEPSPRTRKRVHYWEGSSGNSEAGKDNMAKKHKKMVNESLGPASNQIELGADEVSQVIVSNGGTSVIEACNRSENFHRDGQSSLGAEVSVSAALKQRIVSSDEQQILHGVLQREMKTLCQTLKLPENVLKVAKMFLEYVIKNHDVSSISTSIVHAFQISLCWVAASITKQKVDKKESLMLAKQLLDYQCNEEQASSVYSKMRTLKRMYLQCSDNIALLNSDCLLAEEDFSGGPSNVNEGGLQCSSSKEKSLELEIRDKSADKEHAEWQVLKQQKVALKDKADACEIHDDEIKKVQKKCEKRMKKLIWKHQEQIRELLQIWEGKRLQLEIDHKLDSAFIRSIHGQKSSAGIEKIKLLNDSFDKKIKDHDILKDVQLKNLEAEHLAVINGERQKAADWLAKTKAFSSELRVTIGHQSLGSQSGDDADGPQPSTCINVGGGGDKFPMSGQHLKNENANKSFCTQGNDVIPNSSSICAPADAICRETPVENFVPINSQIEAGVESFAVVELLNQSKNSTDNREAVPTNLPASVEQVCDEIQPVSLTEEHPVVPETVPNEIAGNHELTFRSEEEFDKVRKSSLSDDLVSQRGELEVAASGDLHSSRVTSMHSEQAIISSNCCDLLPHGDSDSLGEENRSAPQIEIAMSEPTDSVTPVRSNSESPITDDIVTPGPSNSAPVDEVFGQLHPLSVDVSLSCNQSSATEYHDKRRISPQTAEPEEAEEAGAVFHESISQIEKNLEMHPDCLNIEPASGFTDEQNVELPVVPQNDMAIPQEVLNAPERPNHAILQNDVAATQEVASTSKQPNQAVPQNDVAIPPEVGSTSEWPNQAVRQVADTDAGNLHPPGFLVNPSHQPTFWNSAPSLLPDPLQNEIERIRKEMEQLEKSHAEMIAEIKSDCEKRIEEIISQMRSRCEVKCQETEAEFRLKKNELDKNQKKVLLNKILAEAFRSKCLEAIRPSGPSGLPGMPSFMLPSPVRSPSMGPFTSQPARSQPPTAPAVQTIPQLSRSHSVRPSPVGTRSVTAQPVQNAAALVSGSPVARPPVISAFTPSQLRPTGEVRSLAPHLQPLCRPTVGSPVPPNTSSPLSQLRPVRVPPQPVHLPSQPPLPDLVSQKSAAEVQGGIPAPPNPPGFTQGLVADHQPYLPNNRNLPIPDIPSTFHSLEQSDLEMLGNALGSQTSAVEVEPDVVCLSDDE
ncbi:hypothetical protein C2S51_024148 [Perilla frutescens var. frutescens]|nr:hypothetical protein C2S51_024148 [Perilla frutescens var. frutescens]